MADKSKIEWLNGGSTWNPIRAELLEDIIDPATKEILHHAGEIGWFCIRKSPGCKGCYACRMNLWRGNGLDYSVPNLSKVSIFLDEKTLLQPLRWRTPRLIFPCSMTDWMDDFVPLEFRDKMLAVMALTPRHTYLTLTKEAGNQQKYMQEAHRGMQDQIAAIQGLRYPGNGFLLQWPLPNLWLGTSAESQPYADSRIPLLLQTPAAVRWVSAEPLLGPIDLNHLHLEENFVEIDALNGTHGVYRPHGGKSARLDWLVAGGESGIDSRPMYPDWARSLRDQCQAAGVPFFFKQWGEFSPDKPAAVREWTVIDRHGNAFANTSAWNGRTGEESKTGEVYMYPVGKKAAGRLLDGKEHSEYPTRGAGQ